MRIRTSKGTVQVQKELIGVVSIVQWDKINSNKCSKSEYINKINRKIFKKYEDV